MVSSGEGALVLFLHGAWADLRIWCGLWEEISERHNFGAITQRHFGLERWPGTKMFSREVHTGDLIAIVRALDRPVHLVGWSYAGVVTGPLKEQEQTRICVSRSMTTIANLQDYIAVNKLNWEVLPFESSEGRSDAFFSRQCDLLTADGIRAPTAADRSSKTISANATMRFAAFSSEGCLSIMAQKYMQRA